MTDLNVFSKRLREAREAKGYTQKLLAEKIGVTPASLSAYEKDGKNPSLNVAIEIAKECGVSIDWLCGFSDEEHPLRITTYADILKVMLAFDKTCDILLSYSDPKEFFGIQHFGVSFIDKEIENMLQEWKKVRNLYIEGTIDFDLYSSWIYKQCDMRNINLKEPV